MSELALEVQLVVKSSVLIVERGVQPPSLTLAQISHNIIEEAVEFLEHPFKTILKGASLEYLIFMENVGGHIELDVFSVEASTYALNIFEAGLV